MTSETGVIKIYLEMDFRMNEFTFATRNFFFIIYLIFFFFAVVGFCSVAADNEIMNYSCFFLRPWPTCSKIGNIEKLLKTLHELKLVQHVSNLNP